VTNPHLWHHKLPGSGRQTVIRGRFDILEVSKNKHRMADDMFASRRPVLMLVNKSCKVVWRSFAISLSARQNSFSRLMLVLLAPTMIESVSQTSRAVLLVSWVAPFDSPAAARACPGRVPCLGGPHPGPQASGWSS
jgi:hypothetical protein